MSQQQNGQTITLENVRLSYFHGFAPFIGKKDDGTTTKTYCVHALMRPDHPGVKLVQAAIKAAADQEYGADAALHLNAIAQRDMLCLHKGDVTKAGEENYAGLLYVSANSPNRPTIVVSRGGVNVPVGPEDPFAPYSGCWANVMVNIWAQGKRGKSAQYGKRINAQLMGVQFLRHDTRFGGGRVARPEEFGIAPVDADGTVPMQAPAGGINDLLG